ncbi:hypothetical protein [Methylocystis sp.]|uniref:hypothetical protein n=1 Tax=Methylocystis sp. TaxID=1911079 RepID=UPI003D145FF6
MPSRARKPAHTVKQQTHCPFCGAPRPLRAGTRKKKYETAQLWQCHTPKCLRTYAPDPGGLRHKTYPLKVILDGIMLFCLGYTAEETIALLGSRYSLRPSRLTLQRWLDEHPELTTYRRLRAAARSLKPRLTPQASIRAIKLYHRQVYEFAYHRAKLALLSRPPAARKTAGAGASMAKHAASGGTAARERRTTPHPHEDVSRLAAPVAAFLESVPKTCPHGLFTDDAAARGSQLAADFIDQEKLIVIEKQNAATAAAALIIPSVGSNYQRHPKLQRFMLTADSSTVAIEIPVWLTEPEIDALERQRGIELIPKVTPLDATTHFPRSFTGHLDFLQVRNGAVHILDYKPGARTDKPLAQLVMYALALTVRIPDLSLFDIKCAWFDEHVYNEFFPRSALRRAR